MSEPLKTITVIVDRLVLAELLRASAMSAAILDLDTARCDQIGVLMDEVESGERCELYAKDWPLT
jgi:hypothetical protein